MAFREINLARDRPGYFSMVEVFLFDEEGNLLEGEIVLWRAIKEYAHSERPVYMISRHRAHLVHNNLQFIRDNAIAILQNGLWDNDRWSENYSPL